MSTILPIRHQAAAAARPLIRARSARRRGDRDGRADRGRGARRDWPAPSSWPGWSKRDQEAGGGMPELNIGVLEKAGSLGEHSLSGAVVNPRAFRELFPDAAAVRPSLPPAGARRGGLLPDRGPGAADPHAADHAQPRLLHRVALRDRPLARRARRGARRQPVRRLSGGRAAGGRARGPRRPHHAVGPRSRRRRRAPTTPSRPTSPPRITVVAEGTRGAARPGVARVAAGRVAQSAALRARREGGLGGEAAARRGDPHARAGRSRPTRSAAASCIRSARPRWRSASWSGSTTTTRASTCTSCSSG